MGRSRLHWITACSCAAAACSLANAPAEPDPPIACGDGVVEANEACDDGNDNDSDACLSTCVIASCGDGLVQDDAEACDDGNDSDSDACLSTCVFAGCGDGLVQDDVETCDDGNDATNDNCPSGPLGTCHPASCGDGLVQDDVEACDDGNDATNDNCPSGPLGTCQLAVCGDGLVFEGVEACDDGNDATDDNCPSGTLGTCQLAICGDGFVKQLGPGPKEACDDSNASDVDLCASICQCSFIQGWKVNGGWGIYAGPAPSAAEPMATPFPAPVFGTDGNRSKPYPGGELEQSEAITGDFVVGLALSFESWHVDEGGSPPSPYDTKAIELSTDGGQSWMKLADCSTVGLDKFAFCQVVGAGRAVTAWDKVTIGTSNFVGTLGKLRFSYNTVDMGGGGFERGWYLRALPGFTPCFMQ